jgi:hypothetical protein
MRDVDPGARARLAETTPGSGVGMGVRIWIGGCVGIGGRRRTAATAADPALRTAGEEYTAPPVTWDQSTAPVLALSA